MKGFLKFLLAFCGILFAGFFTQAQDTSFASPDTGQISIDTVIAAPEPPVSKGDTLIEGPAPVVVSEGAKEKVSWLGYAIVFIVVVGTAFSDKLSQNAGKLSSTLLGILSALTLIVQQAFANNGIENIKFETVASAVVMACLGILAPSVIENFPWLGNFLKNLFGGGQSAKPGK